MEIRIAQLPMENSTIPITILDVINHKIHNNNNNTEDQTKARMKEANTSTTIARQPSKLENLRIHLLSSLLRHQFSLLLRLKLLSKPYHSQ
jgi:hypothetical protein